MNEDILDIGFLETLPDEWGIDLMPAIRKELASSTYKIVVLDDDPTGTQTVRDLPVLTHWSQGALEAELKGDFPAFFILTNSRSLPQDEACELAREIGANLQIASKNTGVRAVVISRSDSTLRGHFPAEVDASAEALGKQNLPYLVIPFFLEGGRYTINDIHYVKEGEQLVPAAQTPFARDAAFGFSNSNLKQYVEEKTAGKIPSEDVHSVTLTDIRIGGPARVSEILRSIPPRTACIINAASYRDMEVVVAGLIEVENEGYEFLYRTAASFVRTRTGLDEGEGLLPGTELVSQSANGGLFVIGSYVPKTTTQVSQLFEQTDVEPIEIDVSALLNADSREKEIKRVTALTSQTLKSAKDAAIYTSRELITGSDGAASLKIGQTVSDSLVRIVTNIGVQPRYLVAKGGITSSDVATKALGIRRAMVIGQALPGVPAWRCGRETRYPAMTYIVFPGNVGDDDALAQIQAKLR
ncbi:MAG: four-carbon acid sugar kinase family protein [Desulfocapsaceae bacterium]